VKEKFRFLTCAKFNTHINVIHIFHFLTEISELHVHFVIMSKNVEDAFTFLIEEWGLLLAIFNMENVRFKTERP
jgi:hypothetical protein